MVDLDTREELAAWLRRQPRDVSLVLGVRWTLRALPMIAKYQSDLLSELVLPSFRVVAVSWAAAKYPAYETREAATAARAAGARAFAATARAARASDAILAADGADEAAIRVAFAFAARAFAGAAADDSEGRAFAAAAGARAFAAFANDTAATAFWSAISSDATRCESGMPASEIAGMPLWPEDPPVALRSMWQDLKAKLHAEKQDWQVWTAWYDDRLEGRARDVDDELAFVRIEEAVWDQGAAIVNAEIKGKLEARGPTSESGPAVTELSIERDSSLEITYAKPRSTVVPKPVFKGFFSYSHSDAEVDPQIVEAFSSQLEKRVAANLVNATFTIWRDTDNLRVGDYWDESIKAEIKSVDVFIMLLTPRWISSDYCRNEFILFETVESARRSGKYIVPIYARDIEKQARFLDSEQKKLWERIGRIQHQQVIAKDFARLTADERIELIEKVADPICTMLDRLRSN